jgi:hypothetical protein
MLQYDVVGNQLNDGSSFSDDAFGRLITCMVGG